MTVRARHVPFWLDRTSASRRPERPRLRGDLEAEVAIIGGGLTGCTIAWTFASAGFSVILLEADRIGAGATAGSPGTIHQDLDAEFTVLAGLYGLRAARRMWQMSRRATLDFAAALRRLEIRCDLTAQDGVLVARAREQEKALRKEYDTRRSAGLDAVWLNAAALRRETGLGGAAGIRTRGHGQIDPFRACLGLAAAAADKGAQLFEKSPVLRVRAGRKQAEIRTARGTIKAGVAILATNGPTSLFRSLRRHFRLLHTYVVVTDSLPAAVRRELGPRNAIVTDVDRPSHLLRWMRDDRIFFSGAEQPVVAERGRQKTLAQRTGQLMYELSTMYPAISGIPAAWSWDLFLPRPVDDVPFLGPHRNYPWHLFALGCGRHGAGFSYLAARILLRHVQGTPEKGDELFAFARL